MSAPRRVSAVAALRGLIGALVFAGATGACASTPRGSPGESAEAAGASGARAAASAGRLRVENRNWMDVRVYGARSGERLHLVSVTSMRADSVALPSSLLGGSGFRLIVDPVGAVRPYATSRIRADVGQVVSLRVENALAQSSVWVH